MFDIPIDFILFALTLIGIAVFHRYTLPVALAGLAAITIYKLAFTGFKDGPGLGGLGLHLQHEWVLLANLFLLLTGFALLSRHFEESRVPDELPAVLPDNWTGALFCLRLSSCFPDFSTILRPRLSAGRWQGTSSRGRFISGT